ncbi:MAG: hypothetical protein J0H86_24410 [Xanthomonadaceae bacterium]|nr:hypothetical protein [Xanthomonadaceae bacterium]
MGMIDAVGVDAMKQVKYCDTYEPVELGDVIQTRVFIRRYGVVTYVPGISKKKDTLEYNGLSWVAIQDDRGSYVSALVDPVSGFLDKKIKFVSRGKPKGMPEIDPFIEPGEVKDDFGLSDD